MHCVHVLFCVCIAFVETVSEFYTTVKKTRYALVSLLCVQ